MKQQHIAIVIGVITISFAANLIRLADAPPLVIASYRVLLASLLLWPLTIIFSRHEFRKISWKDTGLVLASGIFLALHFAFWITSLEYTSIATSVILVTSSPIFVAVASYWFFKEHISMKVIAGIALCIAGTLLIGYDNWILGSISLLGSILAFLGAIAVSGYLLIGRNLRKRMGILIYGSLTYSAGGIMLLAAALIMGYTLTGYGTQTYIWMGLLAIGPQILGHLSLNWALRYVSATLITIAVLGEPIGANIIAYILFKETPRMLEVCGGIMILGGILVSFWHEDESMSV